MDLKTCAFALAAAFVDIITCCAPGLNRSVAAGVLVRLWAGAVIRWLVLFGTSLLTEGSVKSVFRRVIAVHCLVFPVYETGRALLYGGAAESGDAALGGPGLWLLCGAVTAASAVFWETSFPDGHGHGNGHGNGTEKKQKARVLFMRVLRFYKPDYLLLLGAFVFLSLAVLCEMFIPFYTGKVIDILGAQYQWNHFLSAMVLMGLFSLGSSLGAGCRGGLFMCAISSFTCRMKARLFSALVKQEIGFFDTTKTGDITSRLSNDTTLMGRAVALNVNVLLRTAVRTAGVLWLMVGLSWKLTLLMLLETPLTGLLQGAYDTHYQRLSKAVQDSVARGNDAAGEAVGAMRTVRSFRTEQVEAGRYEERLGHTHRLKTRRDIIRALYLLVRRLTALGMQVAMLYYGRLFIQGGQMTVGNLVSFILYQSDLGDNIRTLIYIFGDMLNSVGAAGKVFELLDRAPQVSARGTLRPDHLTGHVLFNRLTFSYPTRSDHPVLQGVSLELQPGQVTALVGPSGGGKTTCVSLLQSFYRPQEGDILLDGEPLHNYDHHYLHQKVAMVSQDPVLFSGSIRDNISYGLAGCSLDRIQEAARKANAHSFISQLEDGYDTDVGERGGQLSCGQKQRIAIARALVREPQVLILDEVTSALDTESEHLVQDALSNCPSQTLLVIAHRLRTIEAAGQIVVLAQGRVQERGSHQELLGLRGTYYRLREQLFTEQGPPAPSSSPLLGEQGPPPPPSSSPLLGEQGTNNS